MQIDSYKELIVWQKAMDLVVKIYRCTDRLPKNERYGLVSQMRRAAVSIPSNIAEGYRRGHCKEYMQFLSVAFGSAAELETQIEICKRLEQPMQDIFEETEALLVEILKIINVMLRRLSTVPTPNSLPATP